MATCKSCNAEIEWATTPKGKHIPIDVTRDGRGNQIETPNGNLAVVAGVATPYNDRDKKLARDRRVSHFVTCVDAAKWRISGTVSK